MKRKDKTIMEVGLDFATYVKNLKNEYRRFNHGKNITMPEYTDKVLLGELKKVNIKEKYENFKII